MANLGDILRSIGRGLHLPGAHPQVPLASKVTAKLPLEPGEYPPHEASLASVQGDNLVPRANPTGSVGNAYSDFLKRQDAGNKYTWGHPKGQPSPPMASAAAPVQPTLEQLTEGVEVGQPTAHPAIDAPQNRIRRLRPMGLLPDTPPGSWSPMDVTPPPH